jgi:soluble lytic murein transglycosylase
MKVRRSAASALAALIVAGSALFAGQASASPALSPWDAQLYAAAFDAVKKGDFATADTKLAQVKDPCLVGVVKFQKLLHPTAYKATYQDLTEWLAKYADLPGAARVRTLAAKRKPVVALTTMADTTGTEGNERSWDSVAAAQVDTGPMPAPYVMDPKAARLALNAGDLDTASRLADVMDDRWTAGLAAFRKKNYDEAFRDFQQVALDLTEDSWVRSGGAYWAARSAIAKGEPNLAPDLLRVAAQFPRTFYGILAERQLGLEPAPIRRGGPVPYMADASSPIVRASTNADFDTPELQRLIHDEPRAKRAVALAQLGQKVDAGLDVRAGLSESRDPQERRNWTKLALAINAMFPSGREAQGVDERDYPMPDYQVAGGLSVDRALLYALIRQESKFNPNAKSWAGAYGLMQVMPGTAALMEGDNSFKTSPDRLLDPTTNLRAGQAYMNYLFAQRPIAGDMMRAVAAYNGGPGPVFSAVKQQPDADALLMIESIPVPESRAYVERVMAGYWIYKRLLGEETKSLDAVIAGAKTVHFMMDRPAVQYVAAPPVQPVDLAAVDTASR